MEKNPKVKHSNRRAWLILFSFLAATFTSCPMSYDEYLDSVPLSMRDVQIGDAYGGGVVIDVDDNSNILVISAVDVGFFNISQSVAITTCADLVHEGYDDWYLPSAEELRLLSNLFDMANTYILGVGQQIDGGVDSFFEESLWGTYWSSSTCCGDGIVFKSSDGFWYEEISSDGTSARAVRRTVYPE